MSVELTPREAVTLEAVRELAADGWPVHVSELCVKLGRSREAVHAKLIGLERKGAVRRSPRDEKSGWLPVVSVWRIETTAATRVTVHDRHEVGDL